MSRFSIGDSEWPGISKLVEECGEVQQVCGKLMGTRGEAEHWDGSNLRERLQEELADVMAACRFVVDANGLDLDYVMKRAGNKHALFFKWHRAESKGGGWK